MKTTSFPVRHRLTSREALAMTALLTAGHALAAAPAPAPEKQDEQKEGEAQTLGEMVVDAVKSLYKPEQLQSPKFTAPLRDIPQTVTVVPAEVIREQNAATLRDVLKNVPGISMQAGEGGVPSGDQMSIRGFSARTDIFVDGVRDFGGYTRDPFNLEQVEVSKGPASANNGRGSTGGSVNLASKTPKQEKFTDVSLGLGTDSYGRGTIDYNQPLGDVLPGMALRLNAMLHHNDVPGRDYVENTRSGAAAALAFGLSSDTRTTLSLFHLSEDNQPDYGIPWVPSRAATGTTTYAPGLTPDMPAPVPFSNYYGLTGRDYEHNNTSMATLAIEHDINENLKVNSTTRAGVTRRDSMITAARFADLDAGPNTSYGYTINRQLQARDMTDSILQNQTNLLLKAKTGSIEHDAVVGIEASLQGSDNTLRTTPATASQTNLWAPNPKQPFTGAITWNGDQHADSEAAAVYAFDTLKFNKHWQLSGGLRYDYFHTQYTTRNAAAATTFDDGRYDNLLNWRAALTYKPVEEGSIYLGYGTSSNPSAEGLTLGNTATSANNINLDAERSETIELGAKWDLFDKKLAVSGALFRTTKSNARTEDPTNPGDVVVLDGEQVVDGIEFGVNGQLTDKWRVFGGYTFMDGRVTESKNTLEKGRNTANTPDHSFSLWTVYDFTDKLDAGIGGQFVGDRNASTTNNRTAPSYYTIDAMASYDITKDWSLRLNLYNLLDEAYIDRVGGGHFVPGPARSLVLSTNYRF